MGPERVLVMGADQVQSDSVIEVDNHEAVKIGEAGVEHGSDQGGQAEVRGDFRESDHPSGSG